MTQTSMPPASIALQSEQQPRSSARAAELPSQPPSRRAEALMFLALAILVWPVVSVGAVGAYGFSIWMSQLLFHSPLH